MTFFSEAEHKFLVLKEGDDVLTDHFLLAADEIVPFFDVLGPNAFRPVKSDIKGNITRLRTKFDSEPGHFLTLQSIVDGEITQGTHKDSKSCTLGLLWLKRALEFVCTFLECVLGGEENLVVCASTAYEKTLKRYHGWLVRGIFNLAMHAVPYRKDFVASLKKDPSVSDDQLYEDMRITLAALKTNIDEINRLYTDKGQHSDNTV